MLEELIIIEEPRLAELAQRMAFMRGVIGVAFPPVHGQMRPIVHLPLERKQPRVFDAQIAEEHFMLPPVVFFEHVKGRKIVIPWSFLLVL